jgi:putative nucleotidyltransferase with HDIG domain
MASTSFIPTRAQAWELLTQYTQSESLLKHALAVEACMVAYAKKYVEDEEQWAVAGLLHDMDYEQHPNLEEHPYVAAQILTAAGYPNYIIAAVLGHADHTGAARTTKMAQVLYAVDELSGFITAVTLVRPSKKVAEVTYSSVKKKMKDKAFARACNRDEMLKGAEELGVPFDEHVTFCIQAMAARAEELGL